MAQRVSSPYADNSKLLKVIKDSEREYKENREGGTWTPEVEEVPVDLYEDESEGRFADPIDPDDFEAPEIDPDEEFEKYWEECAEECLSVPCKLEDENGFFIAFDIDALKDSFHSYCKSFCMNWDNFNQDDFEKCAVDWQAGECEPIEEGKIFAVLFPGIEPSYKDPILLVPTRSGSFFDPRSESDDARWCFDFDTANDFILIKRDELENNGRLNLNDVYSSVAPYSIDVLFENMGTAEVDIEKKLLTVSKGRYADFPYGLSKGFIGIPLRIGGIDDLLNLYESENDYGSDVFREHLRSTIYNGAPYSYERFIDFIVFKLRGFCGHHRYRTEEEMNAWEDRHRFIRNFRR